jgi:hypothetical protein
MPSQNERAVAPPAFWSLDPSSVPGPTSAHLAVVGSGSREAVPDSSEYPGGMDWKGKLFAALSQTQGRRHRTAERLGISRTTLWQKMKTLGIKTRDRSDSIDPGAVSTGRKRPLYLL